ncbi:MAG TPA: hypothetical protein VFX07_02645 [Candidatus Udaeobacter sp.]|nr:hypothetical protein [Candidatus Udaeobacter sp.]
MVPTNPAALRENHWQYVFDAEAVSYPVRVPTDPVVCPRRTAQLGGALYGYK